MHNNDYDAIKALNYSGAKILLSKSPAHYQTWLTEEKKDTPALQMGRLVHLMTLQPEAYAERIAVAPNVDRRTKDGKAAWESFQATLKPGQEAVSQDIHIEVGIIATAARVALLDLGLKNIETEKSYTGHLSGADIKGRPDLVGTDANGDLVVVDLKTTTDASPLFARDVANFRYHLQAAWYLNLTGAKKFIIIAQEKELPCANRVYTLDEAAIEEGQRLMQEACLLYAQCVMFNSWPSYPKEVTSLSLPKWAISPTQ
jgi:hypothetical protein